MLMLLERREILATEGPYHTKRDVTGQKGFTWECPQLVPALLAKEGSVVVYWVFSTQLVPVPTLGKALVLSDWLVGFWRYRIRENREEQLENLQLRSWGQVWGDLGGRRHKGNQRH